MGDITNKIGAIIEFLLNAIAIMAIAALAILVLIMFVALIVQVVAQGVSLI